MHWVVSLLQDRVARHGPAIVNTIRIQKFRRGMESECDVHAEKL